MSTPNETAPPAEEAGPGRCEVCDRESERLMRSLDPDNTEHYVCWSCLQRREKRVNLNQRWRRGRRPATPLR
jgi:hypothetical protein